MVFAAVVGWNHYADTLECIATILQNDYPNLVVGYIDNASSDNAPSIISERFDSVKIILNEKNVGFPTAADIALHHGFNLKANFVLVINNDTRIASDMISQLVKCDDENTGLIAPVIYYNSNPRMIWSVGGKMNRHTLEVRHASRNRIDDSLGQKILEQDFVTGCALLVPRRTMELVGGFDRDFFYYYDDMDLSVRVREKGLKIKVAGPAHMWHKVALTSGGSDGVSERYWMAYSSILFYKKHIRSSQLLFVIVARLGSAIKTTIRLIFKRKWDSLSAYWRGIRDGFKAKVK